MLVLILFQALDTIATIHSHWQAKVSMQNAYTELEDNEDNEDNEDIGSFFRRYRRYMKILKIFCQR